MDLFSITCTTCKSRLKVREEGAVGHILACPKCGGMVMVKPPEGWQPGSGPLPGPRPAEPPAGATAVVETRQTGETLSESNFDAVDDLLSDAPPKAKAASAPVSAAAVATPPTAAPLLGRKRFAGEPPHGAAATTQPLPAVHGTIADDTSDIAPPPGWEAPRPWRYWLFLAGSIVAGIGLALAVVAASIALLRGQGDPAPLAAQVTPRPAATTSADRPAPPASASVAPVQTQPAVSEPTPPVDPAPETPPALVDPPMQSGPPDLGPAAPIPAVPAASAPPSPFDRLLEPERDPLAQPETPGAAPPKPALDPPAGEPAARPVMPRPDPREVDVAARLADPLPLIETEGTPLADFLQVMSDLSTIPVTLEPDALPLAQASAASPVVLDLSSTTVGGALTAGLGRLGLEHVTADGHLIVRLIEPSPLKVQNYPIGDLVTSEPQAAEFAQQLKSLVAPASWARDEMSAGEAPSDETAGAILAATKDHLTIRQRKAVHAQLFLLCEKLRTARRLPHASRFDKALFELDARTQVAASRLATPVTLNFSQPTSLVQILSRLEETAGVRILVDWRDVAAAGWNSAGEATLTVDKQPLAGALTKLLEPMDLAWRVVDGQTIQVLTPEALGTRGELELYPVAGLAGDEVAAEALLAKARAALGDELFVDRGGGCELRYDRDGKCLFAWLPQPRQQQLATLLAQWQAEKR